MSNKQTLVYTRVYIGESCHVVTGVGGEQINKLNKTLLFIFFYIFRKGEERMYAYIRVYRESQFGCTGCSNEISTRGSKLPWSR